MKLRVTLLALSVMAMAWLAFLLLKPDDDALAAAPPPPPRILPDPEPPPPPPAETEEQRASRLKDLDPDLREAVIRIEDAMKVWEKQHPDEAANDSEWGEFLLGEIDKLEATQFPPLVNAVILGKTGGPLRYGNWIHQAWGEHEPANARESMIKTFEMNGMLDVPGGWENRYWKDELMGMFEGTQLGHARRDPIGAWRQMAEDLKNPRMQYVTSMYFVPYILEQYAKQHPEEAWREIDSRADLSFHLVPGFAMGAPPRQDWAARLDDYASLCRGANGWEARADLAVDSLMARWLAEDPDAALAWVDLRLGFDDFMSSWSYPGRKAPPQLPGLESPSDDLLVELEMMRDIYIGFWSRTRLMNEILSALIAKDHQDLAALAIADRLGTWRLDRHLYPPIRSFPDPALRQALLLTAVRKLPKAERSYLNREEWEQHIAVIHALWTLSAEIEVSEEARKQAKTGLRVAYAAEQGAATRSKSKWGTAAQ